MSVLAGLRTKVVSIVRDNSGLLVDPTDYERNIGAALTRYSKSRPAEVSADVTGDGSAQYALPTGWVEEFSAILSIEFPIGETPAAYLDPDTYELYRTPAGLKLRLLEEEPSTGASFRVTFTIPRSAITVPAQDEDAFCNLAASLCLEELANSFAHSNDPTINADSVNHRTKAQEFAARAKRHLQIYNEALGLKDGDTLPPATAVKDLDEKYPGGYERLTHHRYSRRSR
jgi:hypothetical protein